MAGSGLEEAEDILPPFSDEIRPRAGRRPAIAIADDTTVSATEEKLSLARGGNFVKSSGNKFCTMSQFGWGGWPDTGNSGERFCEINSSQQATSSVGFRWPCRNLRHVS